MNKLKGFLGYSGAEAVAKLFPWLFFFIIPAVTSDHYYGTLALIYAFEATVIVVAMAGQDKVVLRFIDKARISGKQVSESLFLCLLMYAVLSPLAVWLSMKLIGLSLGISILMYLSFLPYLINNWHVNFLKARGEVRKFMITRPVLQIIRFVAAGVMIVFFKENIIYYIVSQMVLGYLFLVYEISQERIQSAGDADALRRYFRLGVPLIVHAVAISVSSYADRFVIAGELGIAEAGRYAVIYTFGSSITFIYVIISAYFDTVVYRGSGEMVNIYSKLSNFINYIVSIFVILIYYFMYGKNQEIEMTFFVAVMCIAHMFNSYYFSSNYSLVLQERVGVLPVLTMAGAVISLVGNLVFIKMFGLPGAVLSKVVAYILLAVGSIWASGKTRNEFPDFVLTLVGGILIVVCYQVQASVVVILTSLLIWTLFYSVTVSRKIVFALRG